VPGRDGLRGSPASPPVWWDPAWLPARRTLPSSTVRTPSASPILRMSRSLPRNEKAEMCAVTLRLGTRVSALRISSARWSLKYSFSLFCRHFIAGHVGEGQRGNRRLLVRRPRGDLLHRTRSSAAIPRLLGQAFGNDALKLNGRFGRRGTAAQQRRSESSRKSSNKRRGFRRAFHTSRQI
jgi:hypothetical protein